jgi:hypothetical protein
MEDIGPQHPKDDHIFMKRFDIYIVLIFVFFLAANCSAQDVYSENVAAAKQSFQNKEFLKAAQFYSKAFSSNRNLGRVDHRYNAARCWAIVGEVDSAYYQLEKCAKGNYNQYLEIATDTALIVLRSDIRWTKLLDIVKANKQKTAEYFNSSLKNLNRPLVAILDSVYLDDQLYRRQLDEIEQKYGRSSTEMRAQMDFIANKDTINKVKIKHILDKYGWLGKEEVGEQGNTTLFLVIQHSDLATQIQYLPLIRNAVKQGKARASSLALLEDRVALKQGKRQIYGSQIALNNRTGRYYVQPLDDPENVDIRRAEVGLKPLKEYVEQWEINWSIEQYKKDLADDKVPIRLQLKPVPTIVLPRF